ncbi:growth-regulating factor 4 isoform X2 [Coffea arabica]|uniref:Growth-regulating factor n=1 Tax=Coffea arabica TaxID=13443 RepID=A0A6P6T3M5_COFAR|nr:growth-regulating factor 4-like isoform X2 [Coffea arabica]
MDFNLKQWREHHQGESDQEHTTPCAKIPRLHLDYSVYPQHQPPSGDSSALPLFVTEPTSISKLSSNLSAPYPNPTDSTPTPTKYPVRSGEAGGMGSYYFSLAQWQELELQALIFRHMLAGAAVPPELLHHLVKKTLLNSSHHHHPYYAPHHHRHHYPPHFQSALLQSGYWGRASMDPEPGRCRRTDGKKWRCSRDVVAGQKYCERHMHRGRNRSRKPVEIPTTRTATPGNGGANVCGGILKNSSFLVAQPLGSAMAAGGSVAGDTPHSAISGSSPSIDILHLSQRSSESIVRSQDDVHGDDTRSSGQILRHFFDDWPRSLQESDDGGSNGTSATTNLSISVSGNPTTSDFSLKLSTGDGDDTTDAENVEWERSQSNWGVTGAWGANQVAPMGGPLAEALRSSTSNSSPTSVLHQLQRRSASETSYVST